VNRSDPWGLKGEPIADIITVTGTRTCIFCGNEPPIYSSGAFSLFSGGLLQNIGQIGQDVIGQDQQEGECPTVMIRAHVPPVIDPSHRGFDSPEAAVQAIAPAARAATASTGLEYGGRIFQRGGRFYLGPTVEGTSANVTLPELRSTTEYAAWAGTWHSHPTDADTANYFSGRDLQTFYAEGQMRDRYAPSARPALEFVVTSSRIGMLSWNRTLRYARTQRTGSTIAEACK
jgi:hypothetical protein